MGLTKLLKSVVKSAIKKSLAEQEMDGALQHVEVFLQQNEGIVKVRRNFLCLEDILIRTTITVITILSYSCSDSMFTPIGRVQLWIIVLISPL